ncbi:hypothetical protein [Nocardia concava]|uniref:hypothetical protein n=1 Tax=Nocardia concava TaxID=257281 RepID=UPI0003074822|nr:hypothetical protein [Nocardia concava]
MIWAISLAPLVLWLVGARTARVRLAVGVLLALSGVALVAVGRGWILGTEQTTVEAGLIVVIGVMLICGLVLDHRAAGPGPSPVRTRIAVILCGAYVLTTVVFGGIAILAAHGQRASVPSSSELLPLPAGLVVVDNHSQGCGTSPTICGRIFEIGSANGNDGGVAATLIRHLGQEHGWPEKGSDPDPHAIWNQCREAGWGFDRHQLCVAVQDHGTTATVWFETKADN